MKRHADEPSNDEREAKKAKLECLPWLPREIWQNVIEKLFESYYIEEQIWSERVFTYIQNRSNDPHKLPPKSGLSGNSASSIDDYFEEVLEKLQKQASLPDVPEDPRLKTRSVILRQKEIYGLVFNLSLVDKNTGSLIHEQIWKIILSLTIGSRKWIENDPTAIEKVFKSSYKLACKYLMTFGFQTINHTSSQTIQLPGAIGRFDISNNTATYYNTNDGLCHMNLTTLEITKPNVYCNYDFETIHSFGNFNILESRTDDNRLALLFLDNDNVAVWNSDYEPQFSFVGKWENFFVCASQNDFYLDVCQSFPEEGDVEYLPYFTDSTSSSGKPIFLGDLPILLWFTMRGPTEVFIIDKFDKTRIKHAMSIESGLIELCFETESILLDDQRVIYLDTMNDKLIEYNPFTFKSLASLPIKTPLFDESDLSTLAAPNKHQVLGNFCFVQQTKSSFEEWFIWDLRTGKQVNKWIVMKEAETKTLFAGNKLYVLLRDDILVYNLDVPK